MAYPCCNNVMIFDILNLSSVCSIDVVVVCSGYYRASRTHTEYCCCCCCCCCCFLFLFCTVQNFCEDFHFLPFQIRFLLVSPVLGFRTIFILSIAWWSYWWLYFWSYWWLLLLVICEFMVLRMPHTYLGLRSA